MEHRGRALVVGAVALGVLAVAMTGVGPAGTDDADVDAGDTATATSTRGPTTTVPTPSVSLDESGLLLPNMRSTRARDLQIEGEGEQRRLRFAAWLANLGPGPMLVRPRGGAGCEPDEHGAVQVLYRDGDGDGVFRRGQDPPADRLDTGCMLEHPDHDHWHFDAMAAYVLQRPDGERIAARDKVSFCLRDNEPVPGQPAVVPEPFYGDCTSASGPQGISPGWIDIYTAELDGQSLPLPDPVPSGPLCLTLTADPDDQLAETDETDNATSVPIRIRGTSVQRLSGDVCG